jgi:hypothetical protein
MRGGTVRVIGTLLAIRDHFLILLCLIVADLVLKGVLHAGQHQFDPTVVVRIDTILSWFLVFI